MIPDALIRFLAERGGALQLEHKHMAWHASIVDPDDDYTDPMFRSSWYSRQAPTPEAAIEQLSEKIYQDVFAAADREAEAVQLAAWNAAAKGGRQ